MPILFIHKLEVCKYQVATDLLQLLDNLLQAGKIHNLQQVCGVSGCVSITTHVKISQLVASLQTSRQQVVFAQLVTSCQQVWNKLLTTCNNLVDTVRLVTRLFQQGCYNHDITILLQPCVVNLVTFLLHHDCVRLVRTTL